MGGRRSMDQAIHVCIVGAGISGLRAADILSRQGFKVTILEARDRIGGRISQSAELGPVVDLGPNWIHGTTGNPIVRLAHDANAVTSACNVVSSIFGPSGKVMPQANAKALYEEVWRILDMLCEQSRTELYSIPASERMMDRFRTRVTDGDYDIDTQHQLLDIVEMWGAFMGGDCESQSMRFYWMDEGIEGDNLFMASTYQKIVERLGQATLQRCNLRLSEEVTCVRTPAASDKIIVQTAGGEIEFDAVIFTTPLGWLKRNQQTFYPSLSPRLGQAIENIGYGNLDKVFVSFSSAFWMGGPRRNDEEHHVVPIETLFLKPEYAPSTNPHRWRQEMVSLASLPEGYAHPTIMFYVYGEWGRQVTARVRSLRQDSVEYYRTLQELFEPYYSKLPNFDQSSADCLPKRFLSTDWQDDEFAGYGSYCNFPVGLENGAEAIEVLRQGMPERGIWFAGEHTAPFEGLGTVTGAYWSGERVAEQICERYGCSENKKAVARSCKRDKPLPAQPSELESAT
ncbi:amine oxidase [Elsinoe ampelina]|uniref:Amine oxidase n=1 Tax=Elsinoe ampelina TaxID=302913 RepID=A0A6A6GH01_9PEZI|nr:amine oxidase [Elsinoe ampelina]